MNFIGALALNSLLTVAVFSQVKTFLVLVFAPNNKNKFQIRLLKVPGYTFNINENYMKMRMDPLNETHLGKIDVEFTTVMQKILFRFIVISNGRQFINHQGNLCDWLKERHNGFLEIILNYFGRYYHIQVFECPVKKGNFTLVEARSRSIDINGIFPLYIPMTGNISLTIQMKTLVGKKPVIFLNIVDNYEFA